MEGTVPKYMLIVETSDVGAAYTAAAARNLGYEPFFISNNARLSNGHSHADSPRRTFGYAYSRCR